jgi:hypothetical protein
MEKLDLSGSAPPETGNKTELTRGAVCHEKRAVPRPLSSRGGRHGLQGRLRMNWDGLRAAITEKLGVGLLFVLWAQYSKRVVGKRCSTSHDVRHRHRGPRPSDFPALSSSDAGNKKIIIVEKGAPIEQRHCRRARRTAA